MASLKKILCLSPARCLTTIRAISTQGSVRYAGNKDEVTHTGQVLKEVCFDYVNFNKVIYMDLEIFETSGLYYLRLNLTFSPLF